MSTFEIYQQNIRQDCFKTTNFNRQIDLLIYHHLQANSIEETIESLEHHGVSAHYLIDKNGQIVQIVNDENIAFHAGVSFWDGFENLNLNSLGIEMINSSPFENYFSDHQISSAIDLGNYLIDKYQIKSRYVLGHSDIAYNAQNGLLDRKQDPSHLFDWETLSLNGVGFYPESTSGDETLLFELGDKDNEIKIIKQKLGFFGYKISEINNDFDNEMQCLARVFNRHFNNKIDPRNMNLWLLSSNQALDNLIKLI
ncbi:MAG: N-acetylmuramoyl-L-alanine amidase [Alphaproteobacteria bacterium]|nr:N-acetylmuramoyl-L-alanine amidase [Alphaproteobacteria bacterium]